MRGGKCQGLLLATVIFLERRLVQLALISWLVFEVPRFVFHVGQTHHFTAGSNLAQLGGLALLIVLFLSRAAARHAPVPS